MHYNDVIDSIPLISLYAETHYRFRCFPLSLYYRREPEVVFDVPFRVDSDLKLPVTLIIKDAHLFPIKLCRVVIMAGKGSEAVKLEISENTEVDKRMWHRIYVIDISRIQPGSFAVRAKVDFKKVEKHKTVNQNNYPGLYKGPLTVYKSAEVLPKIDGWLAGDLHTHTEYGCDQVEFGAPLESIQSAAKALGMDWVALTDHSYNLDDLEDDYLKNDKGLAKWRHFLNHAEELNNRRDDVVLIPGEELTCRSVSGRNLHMLVLGESNFIPGTGDSAQNWLKTRSEFSVEEATDRLSDKSVAIAAHPFSKVPLLQKLLVRRAKWRKIDLDVPGLSGWQILNGNPGDSFNQSLNYWISSLLKGERHYIFAGNDAHGNFNRFRQVYLPMIALHETHDHLFGKSLTHVRVNGKPDVNKILQGLKEGCATISTGPMIELTLIKGENTLYSGSEAVADRDSIIRLRYKTSEEFGGVKEIRILTAGIDREDCLFEAGMRESHKLQHPYEGEITIPVSGRRYLRAEIFTLTNEGLVNRAYSNPIWLMTRADE